MAALAAAAVPLELSWVRDALTQSHVDERQEHEATIGRLQAEYDRLQNR